MRERVTHWEHLLLLIEQKENYLDKIFWCKNWCFAYDPETKQQCTAWARKILWENRSTLELNSDKITDYNQK